MRAALVLLVGVVDGDAGIDRGGQLDVHAAQGIGEAPHVGEALPIDAKRLVYVQVVGIEDDAIERNPLGAERVGDEHHLAFRIVAAPRLLVTEAPARWQRHPAGERGVVLQDLADRRIEDEELIQCAAVETEGCEAAIGRAEVENGSIGIVEEEAVDLAVMQSHEEGNAHVHRHLRIVVLVVVRVLEREHRAAPVEIAELLAHADEALVALQSLVDGELAAVERHAELFARQILVDDVAARILERDAQVGPQLHFGRDARRLQHDDGVGGCPR